jgi:hypothetical protein
MAVGSTLACASTPPPPPRLARAWLRGTEVTLSVPRAGGDASVGWLLDALDHADGRLGRFGFGFREPLLVRLHPSVASFVEATGQAAPWLRAWSGWAAVDLLALRFWEDRSVLATRERLTHEVSHCALFQAFGSREAAMRARIPWWFLEGTASVIAGQAARRMPLAVVLEKANGNPLDDEGLAKRAPALAYGAAHHAVAALVQAQGDLVLARVLAAAGPGGAGAIEAALRREVGDDTSRLWARVVAAGAAAE